MLYEVFTVSFIFSDRTLTIGNNHTKSVSDIMQDLTAENKCLLFYKYLFVMSESIQNSKFYNIVCITYLNMTKLY